MSNSAENTPNTEADQNLGAISQLQVELRCQLADVERRGAIWHYEEFCKVLSTYVGGEGAAILLAGEQSAPSVATSSGQQPQQQPERCPPSSSNVRPSVPTATPSARSSPHRASGRAISRFHPVATPRRTPGPSNTGCQLESRPTPSSGDRRLDSTLARVLLRRGGLTSSAAASSSTIGTPVYPRMASMYPRNVSQSDNNPRLYNEAAVSSFLREEGLNPYSLTPQEAVQARQTPDITESCFYQMFRGSPFCERPPFTDRSTICINPFLQPYAPSLLGEPGLLFLASNPSPTDATQEPSLVFIKVGTRSKSSSSSTQLYRYLGTYVRVPVARTTIKAEEWRALPQSYRRNLLRRISTLKSPYARTLYARIALRHQYGREPSLDEVQMWLTENPRRPEAVRHGTYDAAYSSGEEEMEFEAIMCIAYEIEVAKKMQEMS